MKVMMMTMIMCSTTSKRKTKKWTVRKETIFFSSFCENSLSFIHVIFVIRSKRLKEISNDLLYYSIFRIKWIGMRCVSVDCAMFFLYSFCHVKLLFITVAVVVMMLLISRLRHITKIYRYAWLFFFLFFSSTSFCFNLYTISYFSLFR